jgi:hypothetical protein
MHGHCCIDEHVGGVGVGAGDGALVGAEVGATVVDVDSVVGGAGVGALVAIGHAIINCSVASRSAA